MSKQYAFLFPGQGAQYVGMMRDFYEAFAIARDAFEEAEDVLKIPLKKWIFEGPAEELTLTKHSQVAIYVASMAVYRVVHTQLPELIPAACAGLSLGEYTALTVSGKLSFRDCLPIVKLRGEAMHRACQTSPGGMRVVLGMTPEQVTSLLKPLAEVWVANINCPGQVVIAGTEKGIEEAATVLRIGGAKRVLPLEVAGAFHSQLMSSAQDELSPLLLEAPLQQTPIDLVMNVVGAPVKEVTEMRAHLISQVTQPVYWEKGIRHLAAQGIELFIEMGPGKTLAGMNKRIGIEGVSLSIEQVSDLDEILNALQVYATT